jgi:hypothetical protein
MELFYGDTSGEHTLASDLHISPMLLNGKLCSPLYLTGK